MWRCVFDRYVSAFRELTVFCLFYHADGESKGFRNVSTCLPVDMVSDAEDCSSKLFIGLYLFHVILAKNVFLTPFPAPQCFCRESGFCDARFWSSYPTVTNYTANRGLVVEIFRSASDLHRVKDASATKHRGGFRHVNANSESGLTYTMQ